MYLTLAEIQAFINFVNGNIGKKIFTDANPSAVIAGKKLLTNGVGLGVDMVDDISYQLGIVGDWDITTQPVVPVDLQVGQRYIVTTEGTYNGVFADVGDIVEFTSLTSIFVYPVASTLIRLSDLTNYATKTYAESLVLGLLDDRGSYDPTITSAYPTIENFGSGVDGAILKGDIWFFSSDGVCGVGNNVLTGYSVRALVDDPGQIDSNWNILSVGLGYVSENVDNKKTSLNGALSSPNDTDYPSTLVVDDALNLKADILDQTHTGAMRLPSSLKIYDTVAPTKEVAVDVSGLTAGAPRTVTFPDRNIALGDLPLFAATTNYRQYAIIQQDGLLYSAKVAFTSGATFNVSDWDSIGGVLKSQITASQDIVSGYEYFIVASPNVAITLETPDPSSVPDGSRIVIHNLAFNAVATLGKTAWSINGTGFAVAPSFATVATATIPSYSKGATTVLTSRQSTGVWVKETTYGSTIPVGTTVGAGKAYFAREDDVTATVSFNLGSIPSSTNRIVTFPNADVDLGIVANATSSTTHSGAFVYATGMGSVVKTITGNSTTFNVDALEQNPAHSVTIRNGDSSYPYNTPHTFQFVSAKVGGIASGFVDAQGFGLQDATYINSVSTLTITLQPNESMEVRYLGEGGGFTSVFSMQRNLVGLVAIPASTSDFTLYHERRHSLPHAYVGVLNLKLPITHRIGTSITLEDVVGTSASTITAINIAPMGSQTIQSLSTVNIKNLIDNGCTVKLVFFGSNNWVLNVQYSTVVRGDTLGVRNAAGKLTSLNVVAATSDRVVTFPDSNVDLGTLPSVATAYGTLTAGQTRGQILGGSGNTVSGTDNVAIGSSSTTVSGTGNIVIAAKNSTTDGTGNKVYGSSLVTVSSSLSNCTFNNVLNEYGSAYGNSYSLPLFANAYKTNTLDGVTFSGWLNGVVTSVKWPKGYEVRGYKTTTLQNILAAVHTKAYVILNTVAGQSNADVVISDDTSRKPVGLCEEVFVKSPFGVFNKNSCHRLRINGFISGVGSFRLERDIFVTNAAGNVQISTPVADYVDGVGVTLTVTASVAASTAGGFYRDLTINVSHSGSLTYYLLGTGTLESSMFNVLIAA